MVPKDVLGRMAVRLLSTCAAILALWPSAAQAAPLTLTELDLFGSYVACATACESEPASERWVCVDACGAPQDGWEKNGAPGLDASDLALARLEYADGGRGVEICTRDEGRVVVPAALCAGALCRTTPACSESDCAASSEERAPACPDVVCAEKPARDAASCADADLDGVPAWLEEANGTRDDSANSLCQSDASCGFRASCEYDGTLGAPQCTDRVCSGACTVFHLETVASNDREVLVHVVYDHSPVSPRVLDLPIEYDHESLVLVDARPLSNLSHFGRELHVRKLTNGLVRLVVLDPLEARPIQPGPVVELLFQRVDGADGWVRFSSDDGLQSNALAPVQGDANVQAGLADDSLWGAAATVPGREAVLEKLLVWASFDDQVSPFDVLAVPGASALCERVPACKNKSDATEKATELLRLSRLQTGKLFGGSEIQGVNRSASYFDGTADHVRFPVHVLEPLEAAGQTFSFSTWFYAEGKSAEERSDSAQILFSHATASERTRFGLLLEPGEPGHWDLAFFSGDVLGASALTRLPIADAIPLRTWHHVAFALDASSGNVQFYFDGRKVSSGRFATPPPPISCPGFSRGSDVLLHQEGSFLGGQSPEVLYVARRENSRFRIERTDMGTLSSEVVLADGAFNFEDVDYQPLLGKIVFASDKSGSYEIWLADADGKNPVQVTAGFGDSERGFFARHPRFAPDGSAIVFESGAYDVTAGHNTDRGTQLYYIGYDPAQNKVAVRLESGGTSEQLKYGELVASQAINGYQLTQGESNARSVRWLAGKSGALRGDIVFERADLRYRGGRIMRLEIPDNIRNSVPFVVAQTANDGAELSLLAAHRRVTAQSGQSVRLLFQQQAVSFEDSLQYYVASTSGSGDAEVVLNYEPSHEDPRCWDTNRNQAGDADEDRNADGRYDSDDCNDVEVRNLFVAYDSSVFVPETDPEVYAADQTDTVLDVEADGVDKTLRLSTLETETGSFVRIEVRSPRNALPLPAGEVARVRFRRLTSDVPSVSFALRERVATSQLFYDDLTDSTAPRGFALAGVLDEVEDAAFAPDGGRVALYGSSFGRPLLVRTVNLTSADGAERLLRAPETLHGMSWSREERYFACNWVGGFIHPTTRRVFSAFRGGLDETKLFAGLRDEEAVLSEAQRGFERLQKEGRDGELASSLPSCDGGCPSFTRCVEGACRMVECDPTDPYTCNAVGGRCALRPATVEQELTGQAGYDWVCDGECMADAQCFTEACENGPCRFCEEQTSTCVECRETITDYGSFQIAGIEGCPDQNSFRCEQGTCRTECYEFVDGKSVFRCDPALEYCAQGRCVGLEWDWTDFAPGSFEGLTETVYDEIPGALRTVAVGERSIVQFKAHGRGDYGHAPELIVEARLSADGKDLYDGEWFRVGRIEVHNETSVEADARPYTLEVPHPVSDLRVRMVRTPYANLEGAATGLGATDKDFCLDDVVREGGTGASTARCLHRPPGAVNHLGYSLEIPVELIQDSCRRHAGGSKCKSTSGQLRKYLTVGSPTVLLEEMKVNGTLMPIQANPVCSYEGGTEPVDGSGKARKIFYGDVTQELSFAKDRFCADNPSACASATSLLDFKAASGGGFALLNCNYHDSARNLLAMVDFDVPPYVQSFESGAVRETANDCFVEIDQNRREQCYAFTGGDVSMDPLGQGLEMYQSLEFFGSRSFGHDRGFTSTALASGVLGLTVTNLAGTGLQVSNGSEVVSVIGASTPGNRSAAFAALPLGRRYKVQVVAQPTSATHPRFCAADPGTARGEIVAGGNAATVVCSEAQPVKLNVTGLSGDRVVLSLASSRFVYGNALRDAGFHKLEVSRNGAAQFPYILPAGASYEVKVASQPRVPAQLCTLSGGTGSVLGASAPTVNVSCVPVVPRSLGGNVTGLSGHGLTLRNTATGEVLPVAQNGAFRFQTRVPPGTAYTVQVDASPTAPAQSCSVTRGTGTMPNADVGDVSVACTTLPTYGVYFTVSGLVGRGLVVRMNGSESLQITADGVYQFDTRLLNGATWVLGVASHPVQPAQECRVVLGEGTIDAADARDARVLCTNRTNLPQSYAVGGVVKGLVGSGLRLSLNNRTQTVDILGNGSFAFDQRLPNLTDYEVLVDRQPTDPAQVCSVVRGTGRIMADVNNVEIQCAGSSSVALRFVGGPALPSAMRALLYGADGRVLGVTLPDQDASTGSMVELVNPSSVLDADPIEAYVSAGSYTLFVFVKPELASHPSEPEIFLPGDLGLRATVNVAANTGHVVDVSFVDLSELLEEPITIRGDAMPNDVGAQCFYTIPMAQAPSLPLVSAVATYEKTCALSEVPCFRYKSSAGTYTAIPNEVQGLPAGQYALTCWVDMGGANHAPNNIFDAGDRIGFAGNVTVDGPSFVGSQITITLSAP